MRRRLDTDAAVTLADPVRDCVNLNMETLGLICETTRDHVV